MAISVPKGYLMAGVHCRIKRDPRRQDLTLVMSETPASAAGVYTQNLVYAAPVALDRSRTPSDRIRAVAICSGVANACTGERGLRDAEEMARFAAAACGAEPDQALVLSTGVIGSFLPMDKVSQGISAAAVKLGRSETSLIAAARGMLTTDTIHKLAGRTVTIDGREIQITGMAKGAAMMGPNMATMLALVLTDAPLSPAATQAALTRRHRRQLQLHERRRPHEHQRHGAAAGQRRRRRRAAGRRGPGRVPRRPERSVRRSGQGDRRRRRRGHAPGHDRSDRLQGPGIRPGTGQDRGQQPAGEDGIARGRSQLGPHRLGRRLRQRAVRSQRRHACG